MARRLGGVALGWAMSAAGMPQNDTEGWQQASLAGPCSEEQKSGMGILIGAATGRGGAWACGVCPVLG